MNQTAPQSLWITPDLDAAQVVAKVEPIYKALLKDAKEITCNRCNGEGKIWWSAVKNGCCFSCGGKGKVWNTEGKRAGRLSRTTNKLTRLIKQGAPITADQMYVRDLNEFYNRHTNKKLRALSPA